MHIGPTAQDANVLPLLSGHSDLYHQ